MLGLVFGVGCLNGVFLGLRAIWLDGVLRNLASFIFEMGRIKAKVTCYNGSVLYYWISNSLFYLDLTILYLA
jgi:hypothetical protein